MRFHIITIVWGERYTDLFLDFTLPNVLSSGNLPALARDHEVVYRFFTTPDGQRRIQSSQIFGLLAQTCAVEFLTPLGEQTPDVSWHVHWFHRSAAEGKARGAAVVFVPPDTLWTDGALGRIGALMAGGKKGVATPFVLVASETCVPDARARFTDKSSGVITVPANEMWPLVHRHVHPLHALAMPGSPHARPAFELHWTVGAAGMISRYAVRELVAFDPRRCPISFLWYADGPEDLDGIHFVTDSDEMLMLSVDPLTKYFTNYIVSHSCDGFDLARTTRHPLNDTAQTRVFVTRSVEIHGAGSRPKRWQRWELKAKAAARDMRVGRAAMLLHDALLKHGASQMAGLLSVGLLDTHLVRRWRTDVPATVVAPVDAAFGDAQRAAGRAILKPGSNRSLVAALLDHIVPGKLEAGAAPPTPAGGTLSLVQADGRREISGATVIEGPIGIEGISLYLVDRQISPRLGPQELQPKTPLADTWRRVRGRLDSWHRVRGHLEGLPARIRARLARALWRN